MTPSSPKAAQAAARRSAQRLSALEALYAADRDIGALRYASGGGIESDAGTHARIRRGALQSRNAALATLSTLDGENRRPDAGRSRAAAARRGSDAARQIPRTPARPYIAEPLSADEERALIDAWRAKRCAKSLAKLVEAFEHMVRGRVYRITRGRFNRDQTDDLLQEARAELIEAIDKFDPSLDCRFATYVSQRISGVVHRWIMNNIGPTRVGTNIDDKRVFYGYGRERRRIERRTGHPLDDEGREEIAKILRVPLATLLRMEPRIRRQDISLQRGPDRSDFDPGHATDAIENLAQILQELVQPSPEAAVEQEDLLRRVRDILGENLEKADLGDPRAAAILQARKLSQDAPPLKDISQDIGITKERVRWIERSALRRLRRLLEDRGLTRDTAIAA